MSRGGFRATIGGSGVIGRGFGSWRLLLLFLVALAAELTLVATAVTGTALAVPGGLDPTFDGDGMTTTHISSANSTVGNAVVVQPDGKIVVAGSAHNGLNRDFALARYNPNGSLDAGFGTGGMKTTDFGGKDDIAYGVAIQKDGKIVVVGDAYGDPNSTSNRDFALARYTPNGSLDTTFDADGRLLTDFGNGRVHVGESAYSVAIQQDGKIVAAGYTGTGTSTTPNTRHDFALARYNPNGSLDTGFDADGKATADIFVKDNVAYGVAIQQDGKIVAAGYTGTGVTGLDFALARFNPNGSLDAGFGAGGPDGDGRATTDIFIDDPTTAGIVKDNTARSVAIQPNGKIVAGGYAYNGSHKDFALARYNPNGSLDAGFGAGGPDGDGRATVDFFENINEVHDLALQPDGKIVAAGSAYEITARPHEDFALARFNASGTLDAGFGTGGKADTDFFNDNTADDVAKGVALQPNGKIVAAGSASDGSRPAFAVARYDGDDMVAPKVTATTPANAATGVSPTANVTATFSEAMNANTLRNPTTLRSTTFRLARKNPDGTTTAVLAKVGYSVTTNPATGAKVYRATLNPDANLQLGKTYAATVTSGAKDVAGNALDQNPTLAGNQAKVWSFKVRS